jgi:hypothetical protein
MRVCEGYNEAPFVVASQRDPTRSSFASLLAATEGVSAYQPRKGGQLRGWLRPRRYTTNALTILRATGAGWRHT